MEYTTLTNIGRTVLKEDVFYFIRKEYAQACSDLAENLTTRSEAGARLNEIATLATSSDDEKWFSWRNKKIWSKVIAAAVKELIKEYDKVKEMHENLEREEYENAFGRHILRQAVIRKHRAVRAKKRCDNLIADLGEHLGDE